MLKLIEILRQNTKNYVRPLSESIIEEYGKDPFLILISCLLSLRAKDSMTIHICRDLFKVAKTPQEVIDLPITHLEKIIYKIGFYKNKSKTLKSVSKLVLETGVPNTMEGLLKIPGVGRKTANLVMGLAFDTPSICVDIHVHRISNRLGLVQTKTPDETELELKKILPKQYWTEWNRLLVMWGQNICAPVSPFCSQCKIKPYCKQVGVTKSR